MKNSLKQQDATIFDNLNVYRPIQYLGSKVRAIDYIVSEIEDLCIGNARGIDLFSGSSVVSQALAQSGLQTTAVDTQQSCAVIARASLGVQRKKGEFISSADIRKILSEPPDDFLDDVWKQLQETEDLALEERDAKKIAMLSKQSPLFWRLDKNASSAKAFYKSIGQSSFSVGPLITTMQAGYYFGIRQSIDIDIIRTNIERLFIEGDLSYWKYNAALTALLSAMSAAVNSAGKHFAQPLIAGTVKNKDFIYGRLLSDRIISIPKIFRDSIAELNASSLYGSDGHSVQCCDVNEFLNNSDKDYDVVYADPPYTAQQYSRFYHILETVVRYIIPDMLHEGRVTTGLYPKERYLSKYCSKRQAPLAFHHLVSQTYKMKARLILSYSTSANDSDGNARMIGLDDLINICTEIYGRKKVEVKTLAHQYRQFNSKDNSKKTRDNPEVMLICNR